MTLAVLIFLSVLLTSLGVYDKIAGLVIVFGVFSAFVVSIVKIITKALGGV